MVILLLTNNIFSFTASMDSTAQTGHAGGVDWQEECYQKASDLPNCVLIIFIILHDFSYFLEKLLFICSWLRKNFQTALAVL